MTPLAHAALLLLSLALLAPCGTPDVDAPVEEETPGGERVEASAAPVSASAEAPAGGSAAEVVAPEPVEPPAPAPPPDPVLALEAQSIHAPLTSAVAQRIRAVAARRELRDDVFAKLGGSSVESHAFLHCFSRDDLVDLGGRDDLRETLELFRGGRAGGSNPYRRESVAAGVGWSLRQGLAGRPPRALQEIRETRARWALAFFGGNDVQARDPYTFAERLAKLSDQLERQGVVPVLGAVLPRGDDPEMDVWARRYNRISRSLARALALPYIDFDLAVRDLPHQGLAGDGVHPNVHQVDGRGRPCVFDEVGLTHGQNQRNLRTLEALDRLRRVLAGEEPPDPEPAPLFGGGTADEPLRVATMPFGDRQPYAVLTAQLDGYACEPTREVRTPGEAPGPERVYRVRVEEPTRVLVAGFARRGEARVYLLGDAPDPASCVRFGDAFEVELSPGVHHFVVESMAPARRREDADVVFLLDAAVEDATEG
ncbi:MAG TPA: SGNH/GDSL hydrolase family protein [Polyangiaceae bacterium LLY-WYZ-15_(1-7)]|nr:hypothetical protein [Myxococcales bacterium]MAT28467.1 hypothetical protein [Sandaracinus sp.]HJL04196.1 SGNH/GDSL hydrolase family protein [Polyangiaceae bacterium LLY-WYZ-15_(1-7)]MBJ74108.1 hypothetical protein [Sandaracinus sp.]HJL10434.1 SGNH/GDSL hydrolase family protein [Polyangiaceae bacterium LLY-WYZ-15_(1-7)]